MAREWKRELDRNFGINFNSLITLEQHAHRPLSGMVAGEDNLALYMETLLDAFNPQTIQGLMCRNNISVSWEGFLFDCDFNQMLDIPVAMTGPSSLYITAQVKSGLGWRRAACLMPLLIALGIGLAVNNTVAVFKGLFGDGGGEFVRTPKVGTQASAADALNSEPRVWYGVPWRPVFGYELFLGGWSLLAFLAYSLVGEPAAGAFLLVQAIGFLLVVVLSLGITAGNATRSFPDDVVASR